MKKQLLLTLCLFFVLISNISIAQWTTSGTDIYNSNTGNVGVGTTVPGSRLDVQGGYLRVSDATNAPSTSQAFVQGMNDVSYFGSLGTQKACFGNGENWATLTIDNGNVGVGTTAPTSIFHTVASGAKTVAYSGTLLTNTATSSTASIQKAAVEIQSTGTWNGSGSSNIGLYVSSVTGGANNYDAIFNGGGKVGIGTAIPTTPLQVAGDITLGSTTIGQRFLLHTRDWAGGDEFSIVPDDSSGNWVWSKGIILNRSTGNVGIGTTNSPIYKLDVNGVTRTTKIQGPSNANLVIASHDNGGGSGYGIELSAIQNGINFSTHYNNSWSSRMLIHDNGNVGIGTSAPTTPLQVAGDITLGNPTLGKRFLFHTRDWMDGDGFYIVPDDNSGNWLWNKGIVLKRSTGNVGIGAEPGSFKLAVEGIIGAREIKVTNVTPWPDYIFEETHSLMSIEELENFVKTHKHLPNIPSAEEIETDEGVNLGEMQVKHLEKTEELYLYIIELNKRIEQLEKKLK